MSFSRRDALRIGFAGLGVGPALAGRGAAQPGFPPIPSWNMELRQLVPGVIAGSDTLLAIDPLGPPVHVRAFRAAATKATGKAFGRVLNTHHRRDHTNGNLRRRS